VIDHSVSADASPASVTFDPVIAPTMPKPAAKG
jgi:hypothetical protein